MEESVEPGEYHKLMSSHWHLSDMSSAALKPWTSGSAKRMGAVVEQCVRPLNPMGSTKTHGGATEPNLTLANICKLVFALKLIYIYSYTFSSAPLLK